MKCKFFLTLQGLLYAAFLFAQSDTVKKAGISKPKPYNEVITSNARTSMGLFTVHQIENRFFLEIADSLLGEDFIVVNRISKGAADTRSPDRYGMGYSGDHISDHIIRFEKSPNKKILLKTIFFGDRATDSTANGMYQSLMNSNNQPIVAAFDIKAYNDKGNAVVIDLTDYLNGDNDVFFFGSVPKVRLTLGAYQADKSYILSVKAYPENIRINSVKTYMRSTGNFYSTFELSSTLIRLPETPARPRIYDMRVGYFFHLYQDFDKDPQRVDLTKFIHRWRLEPKPADVQKYMAGELVEPQKPIVFYIDPATPKKWVPYLIQGVNDWQKAFETAGFKNAIYALEAPTTEEDSTWSLEDARYSAIVYKPSKIENASGPVVVDPRSGEILESHVNWYHNIMDLLHDWYFVQGSIIDPRARSMEFPDTLMGRLIRFVCSHEIGHTLGLMHNFGASSAVPVDSLRSNDFLKKYGMCPSIMDYARFNYVAQPEDSIAEENFFPIIGDYDKWAIQWGYRWFPDTLSEARQKAILHKWTVTQSKESRLWFGMQEAASDSRCQGEDLGDDAMKAGDYGIMNLKRVMDSLLKWTTREGESYENLNKMYTEVVRQYKRYIFHVVRYVGARLMTLVMVDQKENMFEFLPREKQKAAVKFLHKQLFDTPDWLVDERYYPYRGGNGHFELMLIQQEVLDNLLSSQVFSPLSRFESYQPDRAYSFNELLTDLERGIWKEIDSKQPISVYRRDLQKVYVAELAELLHLPAARIENYHPFATSDLYSIVKAHIRRLLWKIKAALPAYKNNYKTKIHLEDVRDRLEKAIGEE